MSHPCPFCKTAVRQTACPLRFVCIFTVNPQTFMRNGAARCSFARLLCASLHTLCRLRASTKPRTFVHGGALGCIWVRKEVSISSYKHGTRNRQACQESALFISYSLLLPQTQCTVAFYSAVLPGTVFDTAFVSVSMIRFHDVRRFCEKKETCCSSLPPRTA